MAVATKVAIASTSLKKTMVTELGGTGGAASTVTTIETSGVDIHSLYLDNTANAATTIFEFFNAAAGSVTLGTTVPALAIPVAAGKAMTIHFNPTILDLFVTALSATAVTATHGTLAPSSAVNINVLTEPT